jgi:hypothetical protein
LEESAWVVGWTEHALERSAALADVGFPEAYTLKSNHLHPSISRQAAEALVPQYSIREMQPPLEIPANYIS